MYLNRGLTAFVLALSSICPCSLAGSSFQITTLSQFRQLDQTAAAHRQTLRLQAVVNYYVPSRYRLYIGLGKVATFAMPEDDKWNSNFQRGDLVEFTGYAKDGGFSPIVVFSSYRVIRHGAVSVPANVVPRDLSRAVECSRVRVAGRVLTAARVRSVTRESESAGLELSVGTPENKVAVMIDHPENLEPATLIGAKVDLQGVVARVGQRSQFLSSIIFVQEAADLTVTEPMRNDLFDLPVNKIRNLLRFRTFHSGGRAHVTGVVSSEGSLESFYIQDSTQGIFVESTSPASLRPGDLVDVVGYPEPGQYSPLLRYAVVRKTPGSHKLIPARITSLDIPASPHGYLSSWLAQDGQLVEIDAELIGQRVASHETSLLLRFGKTIFSAKLQGGSQPESLETGSFLHLVGVCTVLVTGIHHLPEGMQLLLRSRSDIAVLRTAPWWTGKRLLWISMTVCAGVLLLAVWIFTLRSQVRNQTAQLLDRATRDGLTKIWNRGEILNLLRRELAMARKTASQVTVLLLDLDHFKAINDTFGHQAGDAVLVEVCSRLRMQIRPSDSIGRYGGEELLAILPAARLGPDRERLEAMRLAISQQPVDFGGECIGITCSLGVTWSANGNETPEELIKLADAALYRAKRNGRNCVEITPPSAAGDSAMSDSLNTRYAGMTGVKS